MAKRVRWDSASGKMIEYSDPKPMRKSELDGNTLHNLPEKPKKRNKVKTLKPGAKTSGVCRSCNTLPSLSGECAC